MGSSCLKSGTGKNMFSFDPDDIRSMHIFVYTTILNFMHLLATF